MQQFLTAEKLQNSLKVLRNKAHTIGFVPTMGALHQGHLSLIQKAKQSCDYVVCSIFVNPTQFNDPKDLVNYPRQLDQDIDLLKSVDCDFLFTPDVAEMYNAATENFMHQFGSLEEVLEGEHRKGHYKGVAQIVFRLFDIVQPDKAFFGLKDYQQYLIIKKMVQDLHLQIEIIGCDTLREKNGLAMSSRNMLLSKEDKDVAGNIYKALKFCKENVNELPIDELKKEGLNILCANSLIQAEYFEIREAKDLSEIKPPYQYHKNWVVLCAAKIASVRLIDNMLLND